MIKDVHSVGVILAKEADARRSELERERRVPADLFHQAGEASLFRQLICTELGGLGRSAVEWFRTGVEMARWEAVVLLGGDPRGGRLRNLRFGR